MCTHFCNSIVAFQAYLMFVSDNHFIIPGKARVNDSLETVSITASNSKYLQSHEVKKLQPSQQKGLIPFPPLTFPIESISPRLMLSQVCVKLRQIDTGQINKAVHTDNCYLRESAHCYYRYCEKNTVTLYSFKISIIKIIKILLSLFTAILQFYIYFRSITLRAACTSFYYQKFFL